ncbi:hypothetical protein GWK47_037437 [Chionoecetes opilio]|uniref:Uncharacterized protein n=1 Tax=Chionoecetes opilio TaxID=41210 RepID=A0A8J4YF06_CHIOP|nr:hypothetical protein GWK47_037437 [Chionoecetes opilio]
MHRCLSNRRTRLPIWPIFRVHQAMGGTHLCALKNREVSSSTNEKATRDTLSTPVKHSLGCKDTWPGHPATTTQQTSVKVTRVPSPHSGIIYTSLQYCVDKSVKMSEERGGERPKITRKGQANREVD